MIATKPGFTLTEQAKAVQHTGCKHACSVASGHKALFICGVK